MVDDGVDDSREKDLLGLVGEEVHEAVHLVDGLQVVFELLAPLRKQLLSDQEDQVANVLVVGEIHVLLGVLEAHLDLVHERAAHGLDHSGSGTLARGDHFMKFKLVCFNLKL